MAERLTVPFEAYLRKKCQNYRPIAIRLIVLGIDEASAQLHIVIFCADDVTKRVKKFFKSSQWRDVCKQGSIKSEDCRFMIHACSRSLALNLKAAGLHQSIKIGVPTQKPTNGRF
ncbi:hypothetical protein FB567DRAFT_516809, partial [Paraphoma chrysanthemicola]